VKGFGCRPLEERRRESGGRSLHNSGGSIRLVPQMNL
jgi:hypothetical protein